MIDGLARYSKSVDPPAAVAASALLALDGAVLKKAQWVDDRKASHE